MKKLLAIAAVAVFGFVSANAQNVPASTNVGSASFLPIPITFTNPDGLLFGNLQRGVNAVVGPCDAGAGKITINGEGGAAFKVSVPTAFNMTGPDPLQPLVIDNIQVRSHTSNNCGSSSVYVDNSVTNFNGSGGAQGQRFFWFGGTAKPTATQPMGAYAGTIALTAEYN